jgi:hypothetical protein
MFFSISLLSGGPGASKSSQITVGSIKNEATTLSQKNAYFSKIPPKVTPQGTPETIQRRKKHLPDPLRKHAQKKTKKHLRKKPVLANEREARKKRNTS